MDKQRIYLRRTLVPCLVFSGITGFFTGALIFAFKLLSSFVIELSEKIYGYVRLNPAYLPILILGAALLGLVSAFTVTLAKDIRGGGIPTAVAAVRGLVPLKWIQGTFAVFFNSMITFLSGVPLGSEGPSVQMGASLGKGTASLFGKRGEAWERYVMTGGASSGFAVATGAPLSGIFFAFEEAHKRFTPMLFTVASMSVVVGCVTEQLLCSVFGRSSELFSLKITHSLPLRFIWIAIIIGLLCGFCAVLFTKFYVFIRNILADHNNKYSIYINIISVFVFSSVFGFLYEGFIGSGHHLIEEMLHGKGILLLLCAALAVRSLLLIFANNAGTTGGLFIPTLTFGAIIGAIAAELLSLIGILPMEYYSITVVIGMAAFLAAASRTPLTAITFSAEALAGIHNIVPIAVGVTIAYLVIEAMGITSFTDTVIEKKAEAFREGKTQIIVDTKMEVKPLSFAEGREVRDILWPPACTVLSVTKLDPKSHSTLLCAGDILHLRYATYDRPNTDAELTATLGEQKADCDEKVKDASHTVPD